MRSKRKLYQVRLCGTEQVFSGPSSNPGVEVRALGQPIWREELRNPTNLQPLPKLSHLKSNLK